MSDTQAESLNVSDLDEGLWQVWKAMELPEGGTVPAALADRIRGVPGVAAAVADISIPVVPLAAGSVPAAGHGWSSHGSSVRGPPTSFWVSGGAPNPGA